jgi:hypothetical protein
MTAHIVEPHRVDGGHANSPVQPGASRGDSSFGLLIPIKEVPTSLIEDPPFGGDLEWAPGSIQQGNVKLGLELLNRLAGSGLRHLMDRRPPREAPQADDIAVKLKRLEVHSVVTLKFPCTITLSLSPSICQPFVLSVSKETAGMLRTGFDKLSPNGFLARLLLSHQPKIYY